MTNKIENITIEQLPIIDIESHVNDKEELNKKLISKEIENACKNFGFFYIKGHGIDQELIDRLERLSKKFFSLDQSIKMKYRMELAQRAWRGYFVVGGELTSGLKDWKEGLYLGTELNDDNPLVIAQTPLHGLNLFPTPEEEIEYDLVGFKDTILTYIDKVTKLGHSLMELIAISLNLSADYFSSRYTKDPLILYRIFNYPSIVSIGGDVDNKTTGESSDNDDKVEWGVGEHTDYGVLTILYQDDVGGLQVHSKNGWISAPPIKGTFVCNIGDMLDRMTGGLYRSTPHRVELNRSGRDRISFPLFFDPNFNSYPTEIEGIEQIENKDDSSSRWDHFNIHSFKGSYGQYLLNKIGKVFPDLKNNVL
ncbi:hypothetical protein ACTFIZ_012639 [Dictyostelium cf. discoideum]